MSNKSKNMGWEEAIKKVLNDAGEPMHYNDIAQEIIEKGYRKDVGATPSATVNAYLNRMVKNKSLSIERIDRGVFAKKGVINKEDYTIGAFGMYWDRNKVNWRSRKLLGVQMSGSKIIDFSEQVGVYILYDGQRPIYVGRSESSIIERLYSHTKGKLSSRWNRFSWFGIYSVNANGTLDKEISRKISLSGDGVVKVMEAILIEAMEPPMNRRRGDKMDDFEYIQALDLDYEKEQYERFRKIFWP